MFPTRFSIGGTGVLASEAQRRIVRGSPLYRASRSGAPGASTMSRIVTKRTFSLTKSGRPLSATEAWLAAGLCPHGHPPDDAVEAFFASKGDAAFAELHAAASDPDLPSVMRRRAAFTLQRLGR
jgi:hypothetical protein